MTDQDSADATTDQEPADATTDQDDPDATNERGLADEITDSPPVTPTDESNPVETLRFTENSEIRFADATVQRVHLHDLSFVLDVEEEDGEVLACDIDLRKLIHVMTIYSAMEELRFDWRR